MMLIEDIARDVEPAESPSPFPAPETPAPAPQRGHRPKIRAAIEALMAEGLLPPYLRAVARARVVTDWLMGAGYSEDMPGRDAIEREYRRYLHEREQ